MGSYWCTLLRGTTQGPYEPRSPSEIHNDHTIADHLQETWAHTSDAFQEGRGPGLPGAHRILLGVNLHPIGYSSHNQGAGRRHIIIKTKKGIPKETAAPGTADGCRQKRKS